MVLRQSAMEVSKLCMLRSPELVHDGIHKLPLLFLLPKSPAAFGFQGVILSFSARFRFAPSTADQCLVFQPMQDRIQHPVGPFDLAAGQLPDALNDGVAVAFAFSEDGKDQ